MAVIYTDVVQCLIMIIGAVVLAIISKRGGEGRWRGDLFYYPFVLVISPPLQPFMVVKG